MPDAAGRTADSMTMTLDTQAKGLGLMAWMGAAMLDHAVRAGSEVAAFARDQAWRDLGAMASLATCRDPLRAVELQEAHWSARLAACTDEAARVARMNAEICDVTRARLAEWRD